MKYLIFVIIVASLLPFPSRSAVQKNAIESDDYKIDSLRKTIKTSKNLIVKAGAYNEMGILLYAQNPDTLKNLCFASLQELEKVKNRNADYYEIQSAAFNNIGYIYFLEGEYKLAKKYFNNVIQISKKHPEISSTLAAKNNLGLLYLENGYYLEALLIYQDLRKKATANKNEKKIISSYLNNIGYIYYQLNDLKVARKYFLMGLSKNPSVNDQIAIYQNLGDTYFKESNLKKAYHYQMIALVLSKKINSKTGIAKSYILIGKIYLKQKQYQKSKYLFENALKICKENNFLRKEADILILLSSLDENWKNNANLEKIINRIDQLDAKLETPFIKLEIIKLKLRSSYLKKNADELYAQHLDFIKIQNTIILRQQNNKIQKKEQTIQHIKRRNAYAIAYQQKEFKYKTYILICLFLIILIILLASNIMYHLKNKRAILQSEIEKNKTKILRYNLELQAKNLVFEELHKLTELSTNNPSQLDETLQKLYIKTREQIKKESKWLEFHDLFNDIDKDFMDKLVKKYPNLTENERRLCCFIRMNLTSDEIINILNIAKNTLKSSRFRIHKKMGINQGERLADFILKL